MKKVVGDRVKCTRGDALRQIPNETHFHAREKQRRKQFVVKSMFDGSFWSVDCEPTFRNSEQICSANAVGLWEGGSDVRWQKRLRPPSDLHMAYSLSVNLQKGPHLGSHRHTPCWQGRDLFRVAVWPGGDRRPF
jgi:hypothetical protein